MMRNRYDARPPTAREDTGIKDTVRKDNGATRFLASVARSYLNRYSVSVAGFRAYLSRKLAQSVYADGLSPLQVRTEIDYLVDRLVSSGLLDDQRYADQRAGSLHRRGKGLRVIARDLKARGLGDDVIARALESLRDDDCDPDFQAAVRYARKKRFGPFAASDRGDSEQQRQKARQRALAAFDRQGFSPSLAQSILNSTDPNDLEQAAGF